MRLTRIAIRNHSRIADVEIEVRDHLVLVGPNDVGKSSLLRCLDFLLGASTAQLYNRITAEDFADRAAPFSVEADLTGLDATDKAHFPDEATVDATTGQVTLALRLEAKVDANGTVSIDRQAPYGGTRRQISRDQLTALGWKLLGATAMVRDLREDRRGALHDILQSVDLGAEKAALDTLLNKVQESLDNSSVLDQLRADLSSHLSKALPTDIDKDALSLATNALADDDVLAGVRLRIAKDGKTKDVTEQSDGLRALYALALYDLVSVGSNMVAIDEPEIHLHPTSQRSLARLLQTGHNQKFLATHSPDITSAFPADCIVSVRPGGKLVQPAAGFLSDDEKMVVRWWVRNKLEPLTANRILAVEGISDQIVVERVAELTGRSLDRLGITIVQTGGANDMPPFVKLFGKNGFDVPLSILIDEDARAATAIELGYAPTDLKTHGVYVSDPDLEGEYVAALGASATWTALERSGLFKHGSLHNAHASGPGGTRTAEDVRSFCVHKKHKVHAAMAVASVLTADTAKAIVSVNDMLNAAQD
jgi:putative ATP-dependent endonuclease of the OLD family